MKDKIINQVRIQLVRCVSPAWLRLLFTLAVVGSAGMAQAAERVALTSADLPFYARIAGGEYPEIYHDGAWAAIAFYRPPGCVRPDFNLLDLFDIPAAFGCGDPAHPYLIGFAIMKNVPPGVPPLESGVTPIQSELKLAPGQRMPIWFVRWSELEAAIAPEEGEEEGVLTINELEALPSLLIGYATSFKETLHPFAGPGGQGAQQTMISIVASGFLKGGGKFSFQATGTKEENRLNHVQIEFK